MIGPVIGPDRAVCWLPAIVQCRSDDLATIDGFVDGLTNDSLTENRVLDVEDDRNVVGTRERNVWMLVPASRKSTASRLTS